MRPRKKKVSRRRRTSVMDEEEVVELPTELSEPSNNLGDYTMLWYGEPKIGKTSLAAQFPEAIFLMCEPGGKALRIYQVAIHSWRHLVKYVDRICKSKKYQTVVIDTADMAVEMCEDWICEKKVIEDLSDIGYGKAYRAMKKEFRRLLNKIINSGRGVILLSHEGDKVIKTRDGKEYNRLGPSVSNSGNKVLIPLMDIIGHYEYIGRKRYLTIRGSDNTVGGRRIEENFLYTNRKPIESVPMGASAEEAYKNLIGAFNNELEEPVETGKKVRRRKR